MNRSIKDDIRDYWALRSETYDLSPGHGLGSPDQRAEWARLISGHIGQTGDVLDLGCGTAEIALTLHDLGFQVTGLDMTPQMLARARMKAGEAIRLIEADAENTMEPDARYDAITARYLFWTLPDPEAALRDWYRILRPGGRLLIIDGDHVARLPLAFLSVWLDRLFGKDPRDGHALVSPAQWEHHSQILSQLHFRKGLRSEAVIPMLEDAGFRFLRSEVSPKAMRGCGWRQRLLRAGVHRFAISVQKPL